MAQLTTYNTLRTQIAGTLAAGKARAREAVERETLNTYHEIGRMIHTHLLAHRDRAGYGDQLIVRLAGDVGVGKTVLYQALAFYRSPIFRTSGKLGWSHYCALLKLPDSAEQSHYAREAERAGWSVRELEAQIKSGDFTAKQNPQPSPSAPKPFPSLRGRLYTYRLVPASDKSLRLDVGFGIHLAHPPSDPDEPGALVRSIPTEEGYRFQAAEGRQAAYYSYQARVEEIIDGDTLWLDIDCGFDIWTRQKIRLRSIDTPELGTAEGQRAKDAVEQALDVLPFVTITTTKPDKYDRYLADVFYLSGETDPAVVIETGEFLNRELLKAGLAKRFQE